MSTTTQPGITELLEEAGAKPRGNRHDCPKCGGLRTVTHSAEAFFCHRCQWKGNCVTLQKELSVYRRLEPAESREIHQRQRRAHEAARRLYAAARERLLQLREDLRELGRIELRAHDVGPNDETAWNVLAAVYRERGLILAELSYLENRPASDVLRFLTIDETTRAGVASPVLECGSVYNSKGKFIDLSV